MKWRLELRRFFGRNNPYRPTKREYKQGVAIVKEIIRSDDDALCRRYADEVFSVAYSIGCGFNAEHITKVAESILPSLIEAGIEPGNPCHVQCCRMKTEELLKRYDFHDSNVIELNHEHDTVRLRIDLCAWKQAGYRETEPEIREVSLKFVPVANYKWDSPKTEKDIDYDTILEISCNEGMVKIVLEDDGISLITFECADVWLR